MEDEDAEALRLRERIQGEATYHAAPPGLAARILASLPQEVPSHEAPLPGAAPARRRIPWWVAGGVATAFVFAFATTLFVLRPGAEDRLAGEIVAGHVRSMMVDHAFDVASSDRHTVKPWFAGKLDYSPPVLDLTAQGFALVGGRLDYIGGRAVAALVYRHRQHLINLYIWPEPGEEGPGMRELQGFNLERWRHAGMAFWAVSDLNAAELVQFRTALLTTPD